MNAETIRATIEDFTQAFKSGRFDLARSIAHDLEENYGIDAMDFI